MPTTLDIVHPVVADSSFVLILPHTQRKTDTSTDQNSPPTAVHNAGTYHRKRVFWQILGKIVTAFCEHKQNGSA